MPQIILAAFLVLGLALPTRAMVIWNTNIEDDKNDTIFEFAIYAPDFMNKDDMGLIDTTIAMTLYEDGVPITTQDLVIDKCFAKSSKDRIVKTSFHVDGGKFRNQPFSSLVFEVESASAIFKGQKIDLLKTGDGLTWREWHPAPVFIPRNRQKSE